MKKKKLVPALLLAAATVALSPAVAQARGHHGARHVTRTAPHRLHAMLGDRHHHAAHGPRSARRHRGSVAKAGGRPAAWCGWWLGNELGLRDRTLWLARNWASVGQ